MINQVVLVGRLTSDPELRTSTSGISITSFTIAVDNKLKNADGTRGTSFIGCVAFRQSAEVLCKFAKKGTLIGITGNLNQRKYQRQDGSQASVLEVLCDSVSLLQPKGANGREEIPPYDDAPAAPSEEVNDNRNLDSIDLPPDDDLPF